MNGWKSWLSSKTVWSQLVALLAVALTFLFGVKIDEGTQALIVDQAVGVLTAITLLGTSLVAIYGRITATKRIGGSGSAPLT